MKIGVFFHAFEPYHEGKDPGQLAYGLAEIGCTGELITVAKPSLASFDRPLALRQVSARDSVDSHFWRSTPYDAVVAYTWLRPDFDEVLHAIKGGGKKAVIKADTDGRIAYPLTPRWDMLLGELPLPELMRLGRRRVLRWLTASKKARKVLAHIRSADAVLVESPGALANLVFLLSHWEALDLAGRLHILPNPVSFDGTTLRKVDKSHLIVSVGDWGRRYGGYYAKNTRVMVEVLNAFLLAHPTYRAAVIGDGGDVVGRVMRSLKGGVSDRLNILGPLPHEDVLLYMAGARTFFMPSIHECLSIAALEALCLGCSFVGTPLEASPFLSSSGATGVVASSFSPDALIGALYADALAWERGTYTSQEISSWWAPRLTRRRIAEDLVNILSGLVD